MSNKYQEYIKTPTESLTITPTTSTQTIDVTEKATANVSAMPTGTLGVVSATKGTVMDNSISITPNVAAGTAGYNAMAAYSGDAITVSASELVSGTITTTPKVTSQNVDVTNYATSTVNPIYEEISTSAAMDAVNVDANIGKMYKYTGTTDTKYTNGRLYVIERALGKGDLINMTLGNTAAAGTNNQYRVLSVNGTVAEVVAMYDYNTSCCYNSTSTNTYSGAELDTMLNTTFYNSLSSTAKAAIVQKNIISYEYTYSSSVYNITTHASFADYSTKTAYESIGNRYIYTLDIEDIETYFNNTFSTSDIQAFFNTTSEWPWLRAVDENSNHAWVVRSDDGYVSVNYVHMYFAARPAFCIDLSKVDFEIVS